MKNDPTRRSAGLLAALPLLLLISLLSGCASGATEQAAPPEKPASANNALASDKTSSSKPAVPRELTINKDTTNRGRSECMPTIDYFDALKLGDIFYSGLRSEQHEKLPPEAIGEQIDTVAYAMSDDACEDFVMQSRDATFLPAGTPIYKLRDYDPSFRVYAEGRIFEVAENPQAETIGDLYDIEGKVKSLDRVSGNDGSFMWSYSPEDTEAFVSDLLKLKYVGFDAIFKNNPPEYKTSLRLQLKDGTSLRLAYWPKANALTTGAYGTERMLEIVQKAR
ncbi:hypothetical protein CDO73_09805 [Saccharibacillus sp. O23]|uniref:hypothetical protein n=1 Tax=Saccharibacillus sp. O23 TaxID=2009338 RepID=UPI000B4E48FD|nr:hypothetical protein [Saccharibacillus sp. O23]OWR30872.1 hypothetical protein CDO73_09805 [Saccharibacillus sp. O23]